MIVGVAVAVLSRYCTSPTGVSAIVKLDGWRRDGFRKAWARACRDAGCPSMIRHDFRRTAVRNLVRKGIVESVAMRLSGHKTRNVFERYNIVSEGDLTDAARKLDEPAGTISGTKSTEEPKTAPKAERK